MFDLTSSKLLILAIVALIVVGPKDLPILLRTVGKYLGVVRRQAAEFRAQLDEAMREAELDQVKKEFDKVGNEMRATLEEGAAAADPHVETAKRDAAQVKMDPPAPDSGQPAGSDADVPSQRTGT